MSLYKQLWLAVILLMAAAFSGSFLLTTISAQKYLSEQLQLKNIDNATSLALSLSQQPDPVLRELLISAQFDNSHYEFIKLASPVGDFLVERKSEKQPLAPAWFISLFPIDAATGIAQVSNGWQQIGTLSLKSDTRFAYRQMWISTQLMFLYFLAGALFSGLIGNRLLKIILKPLDQVVDQAQAIGDRRFITIDEPKTLEYRLLVHAMNRLSERVKEMLGIEGRKLHELQLEAETDSLTGLLNRGPFLQQLSSILRQGDEQSQGCIVLLRIGHLAELNRREGREVMNALLKHFGASLQSAASQCPSSLTGRLNGSDFILLLPSCNQFKKTARDIHEEFLRTATQMQLTTIPVITAAAGKYQPQDTSQSLLSRIDAALAAGEVEQRSNLKIATSENKPAKYFSTADWKELISKALMENRITLQLTPIKTADNALKCLHLRPEISLQDGTLISYEELAPWLSRLDLAPNVDLWCLQKALQLADQHQFLSLSLSSQLLQNETQTEAFIAALMRQPEKAKQLCVGFPEYGAYQHIDKLKRFSTQLKNMGVSVGIEQVGPEIASIGKLADLGIDYVTVDEAIVQYIDDNHTRQIFLRGLCSIAHSIGLKTYATGVNRSEELAVINKLGVDGATGAYFSENK